MRHDLPLLVFLLGVRQNHHPNPLVFFTSDGWIFDFYFYFYSYSYSSFVISLTLQPKSNPSRIVITNKVYEILYAM